ncbi:hypothetical protein [Dehalogenimonas etheniformans]|uniref:hypothetical protein n=1 Tax=Dehalogenimonas etheniformans TaxID=1536648 RepID=UPI0013922D01|nr:hypothetical protein [Dehalogenimonas etheniformans]QNT75711.1 hypothetical protein HX448_02895 [Dehalogenimonas etheniformans]
MKIRTQFLLSLVLFSIVLLIVAGSFFVADSEQNRFERQNEIASRIETSVASLSTLTSNYLFNPTKQQRNDWESKYTDISDDINAMAVTDPQCTGTCCKYTSGG